MCQAFNRGGEIMEMFKKVLMFDTKEFEKPFFREIQSKYDLRFDYVKDRLTKETVALTNGYEAICIFVNDMVDAEMVEALEKNGVRLIALRSNGYNNVDLEALYKRIHVVRVPTYSPYSVAEYTVAMILALNRKVHKAYNRTRENNFSLDNLMGFDLYAKSAGIIGGGRIGKILAKILRGFDMDVYISDPYKDWEAAEEIGFEYTVPKNLMQRSDIVCLTCPLTPKTFHLINEESIGWLKEGAMLINTGRGGLVDSKALVQGLKSGKIGSAGLDVYEAESDYFFNDYSATIVDDDVLQRLLTFPNVLITSHQGFLTKEAYQTIAETTARNVSSFLYTQNTNDEICYRCEDQNCVRKPLEMCF
jgi:D-lactate dehydrogenase